MGGARIFAAWGAALSRANSIGAEQVETGHMSFLPGDMCGKLGPWGRADGTGGQLPRTGGNCPPPPAPTLAPPMLTTSQLDYRYLHVHSLILSGRTHSSSIVTLCSKICIFIIILYRYMHHPPYGISSLLHSVNLILFTLLLVHLILRISRHHSHHLPSAFQSRLQTHPFPS